MSGIFVPTAKDILVWLVVLISGAGNFDMPPSACEKYMELYFPGANADVIAAIASPDEGNLQKMITLLGSDEYSERCVAEYALLAAGPDIVPYLEKVFAERKDIHVRFVLERIIRKLRATAPGTSLGYRMLALRVLPAYEGTQWEKTLTAQLSGQPFCIERLALLQLMKHKKDDAVPIVLNYLKKNADSCSKKHPSHLADVYKWLGTSSRKGRDGKDEILSALLDQTETAKGPAVPALLDAINRHGSKGKVLGALAVLYEKGGSAVMQDGKESPARFIVKFAEAVSSQKPDTHDKFRDWSRSVQKDASIEKPADDGWNAAVTRLVEDYRRREIRLERMQVAMMLPADTFMTGCIDVEQFRQTPLRRKWLAELFGPTNHTLVKKVRDLLTLSGGLRTNRIYFSASGPAVIGKKLLLDMMTGVINADALVRMLAGGTAFVVIRGEFDNAELADTLQEVTRGNSETHWGFVLCKAAGLTITVVDDSTILVGYGAEGGRLAVLNALKSLTGTGNNPPSEFLELIENAPDDKTLWGVVSNFAEYFDVPVNVSRLNFEGQAGEGFSGKATMFCPSEDDAKSAADILKTTAAFAKDFIPKFRPKTKPFSKIYDKMDIKADGKRAVVTFEVDRELCAKIVNLYCSQALSRYVIGGEKERQSREDRPGSGINP